MIIMINGSFAAGKSTVVQGCLQVTLALTLASKLA